ncbi:hypothetical protein EV1_008070 [Malus domestica]
MAAVALAYHPVPIVRLVRLGAEVLGSLVFIGFGLGFTIQFRLGFTVQFGLGLVKEEPRSDMFMVQQLIGKQWRRNKTCESEEGLVAFDERVRFHSSLCLSSPTLWIMLLGEPSI